MSVSEYQRRVQLLDDQKCPACRGLGKCDDAEPGDISYNEWSCAACGGSGLTQPAQSVDVAEAIRKGFMTAESCGPDNRYVLSIKFGSLDDLQAAHNALVRLTAALQEKSNG